MPSQLLEQLKARAANQLFGDPIPAPGIVPPEHGSSPYGQNNIQAPSERYTDMARRGGAPFTAEGLGAAFGNAMGITGSGAVTTGIASLAEKAFGMNPGSLGGFSNIPGRYAISYTPGERITLAQYFGNRKAGKARAENGGRRAGGMAGSYGGGEKTKSGMLGGAGGV